MMNKSFDVFPTLLKIYDLKGHPDEKTVIEIIEDAKIKKHSLLSKGQSSYDVYDQWSKQKDFYIDSDQWQSHESAGTSPILSDKRLSRLHETIQQCCDEYTKEVGFAETFISTSWFNRLYKGGLVAPHRHEGSVISGAYFPMVDPNSAPLILENPLQIYMMSAPLFNGTPSTPYVNRNLNVEPSSGSMIIFPSWISHYVPTNESEKRYTVSFNTNVKINFL